MNEILNKSTNIIQQDIGLPLVEKYRPTLFNDILFDDFMREKIKNILKSKF